jgi:hypothetical protein
VIATDVTRPLTRSRLPTALAWTLWALFPLLLAASVALQKGDGVALDDLVLLVAFSSFATVGAVVASRRPQNPVGWILIFIAVAAVAADVGDSYVGAAGRGAVLPAVPFVAWLLTWGWYPSIALALTALPLLFPDGRLPSSRWRPVAWLALAAFVLPSLMFAVRPGPIEGLSVRVGNPAAIEALRPLAPVGEALFLVLLTGSVATSAAAPLWRLRTSTGAERQQMKWFALATALLAAAMLVSLLVQQLFRPAVAIALAFMPVAIGVAILRHRLFDIDLIINKTLVWVPLTGFLGGLFAGLVALLQRVFVNLTGDRSDAAIVISTLVIAGTFHPVRKTLEGFVDRWYRSSSGAPPAPDPDRAWLGDPDLDRRIEDIAERVLMRARGGPGEG